MSLLRLSLNPLKTPLYYHKCGFFTPWLKPVFSNIIGFKNNLGNLLKYRVLGLNTIRHFNQEGSSAPQGIPVQVVQGQWFEEALVQAFHLLELSHAF